MDSIEPRRRPSRIMVLDNDAALVENVSRLVQINIPHVTVEPCASHGRALLLLNNPTSYQAVISSTSLTIVDGNSLLARSYWAQPAVPFLMTVRADEREFAQHWLDLGVYDFIFSPFDPHHALDSVQQALVLFKRRARVAKQEKILADLRQRRAQYLATAPDSPLRERLDKLIKGSIIRIQEATGYLERRVTQMERSLEILQRSCDQNELHARQRALHRLRANLAR